ncbi:estradiol 17-beta-dehydrogenase 2 [Trichonephila clavata]|uniref:Estradiol 17-beta-dehydrogenase 2 n=1 Tax=Trichonephila clavata TaxID=2740835 RepID=A0A8X6KQJ8_TRICU|nr:estradiol 17-beta-dehydrogenase 2 [Trichonephila clavata]
MIGRYIIFASVHLFVTFSTLKILSIILPCSVTCYCSCAANFLLCLFVAILTFGFTKKRGLNDKIQPSYKAVLITGCDTGFGNALAKQLDTKGFHVFASCLSKNSPGADDLRKSCSDRLKVLEMDVTKDESVKDAVQFVKYNLGTCVLWAVVNNAGIQKGFTTELSRMQDFKDTMEVNAFGPVRVTKAFLPLLKQSKGRVINVASVAGRLPMAHSASYAMSKHACVGFSKSIRLELDVWGIQVISIEPAFFKTPLADPENISKRIDESFEHIDEDIRNDYGDAYFKKFKEKCHHLFGLSFYTSNIHFVIDDIETAVSVQYPDTVYTPCGSIFILIFIKCAQLVPDHLQILFLKFFSNFVGFPKPIKAN